MGTGRAPNSRTSGVFPSREGPRNWRRNRGQRQNSRARAGAIRGRRDGHTGTEVILGSRDEEGGNRREERVDSSKHGGHQARLAHWKLGKKAQFISPEIPRQFAGERRSRKPKKDDHHSTRSMRQTDTPDRKTEQAEHVENTTPQIFAEKMGPSPGR